MTYLLHKRSYVENITMKTQEAASANGIQMHYVIEGQGDTVVLLYG